MIVHLLPPSPGAPVDPGVLSEGQEYFSTLVSIDFPFGRATFDGIQRTLKKPKHSGTCCCPSTIQHAPHNLDRHNQDPCDLCFVSPRYGLPDGLLVVSLWFPGGFLVAS